MNMEWRNRRARRASFIEFRARVCSRYIASFWNIFFINSREIFIFDIIKHYKRVALINIVTIMTFTCYIYWEIRINFIPFSTLYYNTNRISDLWENN